MNSERQLRKAVLELARSHKDLQKDLLKILSKRGSRKKMDDILKANPVFLDPKFKSDTKRWEKIRDAVEKEYPKLSKSQQAKLIGELMRKTST